MKFVKAKSYHKRHGAIKNKFNYRVDMVYVPVHKAVKVPSSIWQIILSYNKRASLFSLHDKDHGFQEEPELPLNEFARKILKTHDLLDICDGDIWLLTQPRIFGYVFNPVSFWYYFDKAGALRAVLAEVNNTAGQRHFYLCHHKNGAEILKTDHLRAKKLFYVSPYQSLKGEYDFRFDVGSQKISTWINYMDSTSGVYADLKGTTYAIKNRALLFSALTQPLGALKIISLIYWQALKLKCKGATFRKLPVQTSAKISSTK